MNTRPIPKSLLRHTCKLSHCTVDEWGAQTAATVTDLEHVRVEPSTQLVVTKENREVRLSAVLFYDCANSTPKGVTFSVNDDDKVEFGGKTYAVVSVDTLYAEKTTPHHYEIGLV